MFEKLFTRRKSHPKSLPQPDTQLALGALLVRVALAALLMCIMRMLYRLRTRNQRWRIYTPMLIKENRWRAMRYSFDEGLVDLARGEIVPFETLLDEAAALGLTPYFTHGGTVHVHGALDQYERFSKAQVIQEVEAAGFGLVDDKPMMRTNYFLEFIRSGEKNDEQ